MRNYLLILWCVLMASLPGCSGALQTELEGVDETLIQQKKVPLFIEKENPDVFQIHLDLEQAMTYDLQRITLILSEGSQADFVKSVDVSWIAESMQDTTQKEFGKATLITDKKIEIEGAETLMAGSHSLSFQFVLNDNAALVHRFSVEKAILKLDRKQLEIAVDHPFAYRPAKVLRAAGQDQCDTYRIPGLVTTNEGTLIAVYDNRYNNSKDLQEDIDIGMSRSTDGGESWEPMRVIMDMGKWGGRSERLNGIGDPSVLYDHVTGTIWVAALWMSGATEKDMLWWASKPGLSPELTGQFMVAKSTDDGLTWSEPINITEQVKDPAWQLLLQGPGRGITLEDGTLVFPAQFKADIGEKALDGGQYTCHSTIVFSKDAGESWEIGTGAKANTTEAQVVQLSDGSLMLNMRDDQNRKDKSETNGRAVAVSTDLGTSWELHPTSNSALQEPNCMASIIAADIEIIGENKRALFFSNPNNKHKRTNMTIKVSLDDGMTWPDENQLELNEAGGYGYSCMTMVDEKTVGILYEGVKALYFQKVPVADIIQE